MSRRKNQHVTTKSGEKLWAGRFRERTSRLVEAFTASVSYDRRLYAYDIQGSIAHAKTLERANVLSDREAATTVRGLEQIRTELDEGHFPFAPQDEDIHMAIERRLTELIGPLGGKLHTGRSRNDQVALDLRLYLKDALNRLLGRLLRCERALLGQAREHLDVVMPGYTHLQRAQPVLLAHHWLAYIEMFERDKGRLRDALVRIDVMPLGSGALAGTNYPVDRS
jgi:argininosuccinate lyase